MHKLSIIVPVFEARDYIVTCLDSIIFQTMKDMEVILVDDHGNDGTIDLVRDYLEKYKGETTFRIVSTEANSGPGSARNLGISESEGQYIAFIDADDWIESNFCEKLCKAADSHKADIAFGSISLDHIQNGTCERKHNPSVRGAAFTGGRKSRYLTHFTSYFTTYIYSRELLVSNGIKFPPTRSSEDSCFLTCALLAAERIASDSSVYYHYMLRNESLSLSLNDRRYIQKMESFATMISFAKEHNLYLPHKEEIDFIYLKKGFIVSALTLIKNSSKVTKDELKELTALLQSQIPDYKSNRYYMKSLKARVLTSLITRHPAISILLISKYLKKSKRML